MRRPIAIGRPNGRGATKVKLRFSRGIDLAQTASFLKFSQRLTTIDYDQTGKSTP